MRTSSSTIGSPKVRDQTPICHWSSRTMSNRTRTAPSLLFAASVHDAVPIHAPRRPHHHDLRHGLRRWSLLGTKRTLNPRQVRLAQSRMTQCMVRPRGARGFWSMLADAVLRQCIRSPIGACAPGPGPRQRCDRIGSSPLLLMAHRVFSMRCRILSLSGIADMTRLATGSTRSRMPSRPREFHPEPLTDSVREPLDSYGSCHRMKAAAFH